LCGSANSVIMTVMLSQLDKGAMANGRPEEQLPLELRKRR
jgi:hypothetical protein